MATNFEQLDRELGEALESNQRIMDAMNLDEEVIQGALAASVEQGIRTQEEADSELIEWRSRNPHTSPNFYL